MRVFGLELSAWMELSARRGTHKENYFWRDTNCRESYLSSTNSFVQIVPPHNIVGTRNRVEFGHKLSFLQQIFDQQYSQQMINKLEIKELKKLIDKFLQDTDKFKTFL